MQSSAKEKDYPALQLMIYYFCLGISCPEGLILNHSDPSECFVLFPTTAPITEIYSLNEGLLA